MIDKLISVGLWVAAGIGSGIIWMLFILYRKGTFSIRNLIECGIWICSGYIGLVIDIIAFVVAVLFELYEYYLSADASRVLIHVHWRKKNKVITEQVFEPGVESK